MGGHGGLNILPQKRWNVYNYDNREKVRRDEEAAAKDDQLKREQARRRDSEFRLQQLRTARGLEPNEAKSPPPSDHINLFEGIRVFDPKAEEGGDRDGPKKKKAKKEDVKIVSAEDEKYRVGYGVAGKGVKAPWYLQKKKKPPPVGPTTTTNSDSKTVNGSKSKKSVEELREERLSRERGEKQRERALIQQTRTRF